MFIKVMTVSGHMLSWLLMLIAMTIMLKTFVNNLHVNNNTKIFNTHIKNTVISASMTFILAFTIFGTMFSLGFNLYHWYWGITGIITTFIIFISISILVRFTEKSYEKELTEKEIISLEKVKKPYIEKKRKRMKYKYAFVIALSLAVYVVIILNAWGVIPIRDVIFPPLMPIYMHILWDWFQIGLIILFQFPIYAVINDWLKLEKMYIEKSKK